MATPQLLDREAGQSRLEHERQVVQQYRRLGLWNGLFIGLALSAGIWLPQIIRLATAPVQNRYGSIVLAAGLLLAVCTLVGWLTARLARTWLTLLLWTLSAAGLAVLVAYQPNWLRTVIIWLADPRFFGRSIYPSLEGRLLGVILSGFFVILLLAVLAILQDYRLEGAQQALGSSGRLNTGALVRLFLPLPLVVVAGIITAGAYGGAEGPQALSLVDAAIGTVQGYSGDLTALGQQDGINYSALRGVRDQVSGDYILILGDTNSAMSLTVVTALFDNGAWINCQVINRQLTFCADASRPYTVGLASLVGGPPVPEDCRGCLPRVDEGLAEWLAGQGRSLNGPPQVSRLVQRGTNVLMQVADSAGQPVLTCWFAGNTPIILESCETTAE